MRSEEEDTDEIDEEIRELEERRMRLIENTVYHEVN